RSGRPARRPPDQGTPPTRARSPDPARRPPGDPPEIPPPRPPARTSRPVRPSWPSCPTSCSSPFSSLARVQGMPPAESPGPGPYPTDRAPRRAAGSSVPYITLGVLHVGSTTVHLLAVDAHAAPCPLPALSHKAELRLAPLLDGDGAIGPQGMDRL